jgi:hypothetical protein
MIVRAATIVWGLAVSIGLLALTGYSARPGDPGDPTPRWPSESRIAVSSDRSTLVLFLDPLCPCSSATLAELQRCLARFRTPIAVHAVVVGREAEGRMDRTLKAIAGVHRVVDDDGDEMRRFGASTSGHVLFYSPDGRLVFSGGITPARGHEGESVGGLALRALGSGQTPMIKSAPVYGCLLQKLSPKTDL